MTDETRAPLRIGVIGAGTISQSVHLPSVRRAGLDLTWICDLSPSRAAAVSQAYGVKATTSPAEVFAADDVDAVLIATPGSHAHLAAQALTAGKHVLAEKPVAMTLREIDDLDRLAHEKNLIVQVGYMKMYDPLAPTAREQVALLKDIRLVRITVSHPADDPQIAHLHLPPAPGDADPAVIAQAEAQEYGRVRDALGAAVDEPLARYYANVLNGSVIHELSVLRSLGLALPDHWEAETFPCLDGDAPACLLAHAAVGQARYVLSWNWLPEYPEYEEDVTILASNGRMTYTLARPYLLESRSHLRVQRYTGTLRHDTHYTQVDETGFLRQLLAFSDSVLHAAPVVADLAGARRDIAQLQLIAAAIARATAATCDVEVGR